ncbi:MAG: hypothetical protein PHX39_12815, partial [Bacteroidales bacterium]|nr:hypothetical protein [Bacteroidales bacterium]
MTTLGIKQRPFEGINNIDESEFLLTRKELIDRKYSETQTPILTENQKLRMKESLNQINNGDFLTDDPLNELIGKWLK